MEATLAVLARSIHTAFGGAGEVKAKFEGGRLHLMMGSQIAEFAEDGTFIGGSGHGSAEFAQKFWDAKFGTKPAE